MPKTTASPICPTRKLPTISRGCRAAVWQIASDAIHESEGVVTNRSKSEWESARVLDVRVVTRGPVANGDRDYGVEKLEHALRVAPGPVLHAELRLTQHKDPARVARAFAEGFADINGRPIHARASGATMHEALDFLVARFQQRIDNTAERIEAQHLRFRDTSTWHHADGVREHAPRPGTFMRDEEERQLIRRKSFAAVPETIDEAILEMEMLDHDFFLFINCETNEENAIEREGDGYRLFRPHPNGAPPVSTVAPVVVDSAVAPRCSVAEARAMLALGDVPGGNPARFVFFIDAETDRGALVYRRYDGHDALITVT
jgi:hypothetical protein